MMYFMTPARNSYCTNLASHPVRLALVAEGPEGLVQRPVHHLRRAPGLVGIFDRLFYGVPREK